MPVPIQFYSVVVPKSVIELKYYGGLEQYKKDVPNRSYIEDEYLTRVGFMNPIELEAYCDNLNENGLHYEKEKMFSTDFVVAQYLTGKRWKAEWLEINDLGWAYYTKKNDR